MRGENPHRYFCRPGAYAEEPGRARIPDLVDQLSRGKAQLGGRLGERFVDGSGGELPYLEAAA